MEFVLRSAGCKPSKIFKYSLVILAVVIDMKKFITELRGKTVMTNDGQILGVVDNFVVDSASGEIEHMLVVPAEELDTRTFKLDNQNRIILPFKSMKAVKDVIVMDLGGQ